MPVAPPPPAAHEAAARPLEQAIVRNVNLARAYTGLPRLRTATRLKRLAGHHTFDMIRRNTLSHDGDGTTFESRVRQRTNYALVGETLAFVPGRHASARRVVRAWIESPAHRAEVLNGRFRSVGVGAAHGRIGGRGGVVITANYATPH